MGERKINKNGKCLLKTEDVSIFGFWGGRGIIREYFKQKGNENLFFIERQLSTENIFLKK